MNPASRKFDPEKSILNQRAVDAERSAEAANARLALEVERSTALRAESDRRDRAAQHRRWQASPGGQACSTRAESPAFCQTLLTRGLTSTARHHATNA